VVVGAHEHLALDGVAVPASAETGARSLAHVAVDGTYAGVLEIADPPAREARGVIAALRRIGIEPVMVTGDREEVARWIAGEVGIARLHADVRPTGKSAIVAAEQAAGRRVAMVGDGINDAPALATADLGIALASGTDIAAASAEVTLIGGISALPTAFSLARATMRTIRRNLVAASAYNLICIPIAAAGLLSPVLASAAMSLSSVSVLVSSLALRRTAKS
jgi:P-type Cu+ transporter